MARWSWLLALVLIAGSSSACFLPADYCDGYRRDGVIFPRDEPLARTEVTSAARGALWWIETSEELGGEVTLASVDDVDAIVSSVVHRTSRVVALRVPTEAGRDFTPYEVPGTTTRVEIDALQAPPPLSAEALTLTFVEKKISRARIECGECLDGADFRGGVLAFNETEFDRVLVDIWISNEDDSPFDDLTPRMVDSASLVDLSELDDGPLVFLEERRMQVTALAGVRQLEVQFRDAVSGLAGPPLSIPID